MKFVSAIAVACGLLLGSAGAVVLDFENVPNGSRPNTFGEMPATNGAASYEGFVFTSNLDWIDTVQSTWNYGARSGEFTLLNNNAGVGIVSRADGGTFSFGGLWAKSWATLPQSGGPDRVFGTLSGWRDGQIVWTIDTGLNGSFRLFGAQAGEIDQLHLGFGNFFLVDDLALDDFSAAPVPVPGALPLFAGAAAFASLARRWKKR